MKKLFADIALLFASLVAGFLIMEGALRLLGIGYPLFTQADAWTGFALRPGTAGWQTDEGRAWVAINGDGMRDVPHAKEKPAGVLRIAVLGDSFAEARQVDVKDTFWSVMGSELNQCPLRGAKTIEVLNFGVSGFGTTQELLQLESRVFAYQPDIVLLAFTTGNDVRNNSFALEGNTDKPYMSLVNGTLVTDMSFRDRPTFQRQMTPLSRAAQWALAHSRVLQLLNRARSILSRPTVANVPTKAPANPGVETGLDTAIYLEPPPSPAWKEAWAITDAILARMNSVVRAHGVAFAVATLSNGIQVNPDPAARAAFAATLGVHDLFAPERHVSSVGAKDGFPVFALAQPLAEIAQQKKMVLHGFANATIGEGHWNENGHREAGKLIARTLCTAAFLK